jgi:hypothetical protein
VVRIAKHFIWRRSCYKRSQLVKKLTKKSLENYYGISIKNYSLL